ncbi:MAG: DUF5107 domain-containing protein, partial [Firmicutes bacterium]|nr:DUF5107 domain-containing protein [Bacillota bacterium]
VGIRGHNVFTSSAVFCSVNSYQGGRETVMLYEYERIRGVVWSVELYLPDGGESLFARARIENASEEEKHMYWWTNIAVAETPRLRVLTLAEKFFLTSYEDGKNRLSVRSLSGADQSINPMYPALNARFCDFFYKIPEDKGKWIVCADENGRGLAHTSSDMLKGRKLFAMGAQSSASRNWAEFLSVDGERAFYAEIQAGLSFHQYEHIPMPPDTTWQWEEAFTPFEGDPELLHSPDISVAQNEAERNLRMTGKKLEQVDPYAGITPGKLICSETVTLGSGWGYIENLVRSKCGRKRISETCVFAKASVSDAEEDWLYFIENGAFPSENVAEPPKSFMVEPHIAGLLKEAVGNGSARGAYTYLQLGTALFAQEKYEEAAAAWEKSMELMPNAWAARNIAMLKRHSGAYEAACAYMLKAVAINSEYRPLIIDCAKVLTEAGKYAAWLNIYAGLNPRLKSIGRVKYLTALAYMELDMIAEAESLINKNLVIDDLLEGELSLEKLWEELHMKKIRSETPAANREDILELLHARYPLPRELNFRTNIKA